MEKVHKMIKTLFKNQENLAAKLYSFEKRLGVILSSQLTCNESVSKVTNDIDVLTKMKAENTIAIDDLNKQISNINSEQAGAELSQAQPKLGLRILLR